MTARWPFALARTVDAERAEALRRLRAFDGAELLVRQEQKRRAAAEAEVAHQRDVGAGLRTVLADQEQVLRQRNLLVEAQARQLRIRAGLRRERLDDPMLLRDVFSEMLGQGDDDEASS